MNVPTLLNQFGWRYMYEYINKFSTYFVIFYPLFQFGTIQGGHSVEIKLINP